MSFPRVKRYSFEIFFFSILYLLGFIKILHRGHYLDFDVYYRAAKYFLHGDFHQVYSMVDTGSSPFRYSPLTLPFFLPFAFFSKQIATHLFFNFQFGAIFFSYVLLFKECKTKSSILALRISTLLVFRYLLDSLWIGQITGALFLLSTWFYIALKRLEFATATLLVGFMSAFKITHLVLMLPVIWLAKGPSHWKRMGLGILPYLFLLALLMTSDSSFLLKDWIGTLFMDDAYFDSAHYANQSLRGVLGRILEPQWVENIWKSVVLFVFTIGLLRRKKEQDRPIETTVGATYLLLVILSPESFKYTFSFLFFPLFAVLLNIHSFMKEKVQLTVLFVLHLFLNYEFLGRDLFLAIYRWNVPFLGLIYLAVLLRLIIHPRNTSHVK